MNTPDEPIGEPVNLPWLQPVGDDEAAAASRRTGLRGAAGLPVLVLGGLVIVALLAFGWLDRSRPSDQAPGGTAPAALTPPPQSAGENAPAAPAAVPSPQASATPARPSPAHPPRTPSKAQAPGGAGHRARETKYVRVAAAPSHREKHAAERELVGPVIQVGAYFSRSDAEHAWRVMNARYPALRRLQQATERGSSHGRTVFRLRAAGAKADAVCHAIRTRGGECLSIPHP